MSSTNRFPYTIVDLTHTLSPKIPTWDGSCGFNHHVHHDYDPSAQDQFRTHKISMNEGIGTHIDSPAHCIAGGRTIDALPLENLCVPCVMIDVSGASHDSYSVSVKDIKGFEKNHGDVEAGSLVLFRTGWERFWREPEKYRNNHRFPSISKEAAEFLLNRGIVGLGLDTLSPDRGDDGFPVHKIVLGNGGYIIENAFNLSALPPQGSFAMALPLKIENGTEAPVRLIGLLKP